MWYGVIRYAVIVVFMWWIWLYVVYWNDIVNVVLYGFRMTIFVFENGDLLQIADDRKSIFFGFWKRHFFCHCQFLPSVFKWIFCAFLHLKTFLWYGGSLTFSTFFKTQIYCICIPLYPHPTPSHPLHLRTIPFSSTQFPIIARFFHFT